YIMIGNFFTSANTNTLPSTGLASYFFVDEVCVSTSSVTCNMLNNLREDYLFESFSYYPNPTSDKLTISLKSEFNSLPIQLEIHDFSGQKIKQILIETPNTTIDTSELSSGFYFLKFKLQNYSQITKTFIINRE
ncbi:MAG: T9SS type A sorting domain-containing protein, partial [Sphingobacteriaceae bacterium]